MPDRKSLTSDCEPKPSATPTTPAPASSGATSTPTSDSTAKVANNRITKPATLRRTLVRALMRWSARRLASEGGIKRPAPRRRTAPTRSRTTPEATPRSVRSIARPTKRLRISAPSAMRMIASGVPMTKSATSASASLSVRS